MARDGPRWGWEGLFPDNLNLANILGDMDFDFENFYFLIFLGSRISGLGPAWARPLGPGWGPSAGPGAPLAGPGGPF